MKILVTGATGGLGRLVVKELLNKGISVISCSRNIEKADKLGFLRDTTFRCYDIGTKDDRDLYDYFGKPDSCIHLAWENLDNFRTDNHLVSLESHKSFLSRLLQTGLKDLTGIGTCYEYGLREGELFEDMPSEPTLPYSIAKNLLRKHCENESAVSNAVFKWTRIFYVFGFVEGRKNLFNSLTEAINKGDTTFNMSGGEQIRDFLPPEKVAEIIVRIALQKKVTGIVNCCSGQPVKLRTMMDDFIERNKYSIKLNYGVYPYPDYEPMVTFGSTRKLSSVPLKEQLD